MLNSLKKHIMGMISKVRDNNRKSISHEKPRTIFSLKNYWTYFLEERELPFKVELVSEAKCHERVLAAGVPDYNMY